MSFLFSRNKIKTPQELIRLLSEQFDKLDFNSSSDLKRSLEDISRLIVQIRVLLCGDQEVTPSPDQIGALSQEVYSSNVLVPLIAYLHLLDFEARKDVVLIFTTLLRRQIGPHSPTVDYLMTKPEIFKSLIEENANQDVALNVGTIVRDCCKHEQLVQMLLSSPDIWKYFNYIGDYNFEVSTDAFCTLQDLLTLHPQISAKFLVANSQLFTKNMTSLMTFNSNYVTKRQSLKLMAQLMRQRANYTFMTEYIDSVDNLKLIMGSLKDKSKNIQYEAFQIFKIFVANPKKTKPILDILVKNKVKLLNFLAVFHSDRDDDEAFKEEKEFIINEIQSLPNYAPGVNSVPSASDSAPPTASNLSRQNSVAMRESESESDSFASLSQLQAPQVVKPSNPIAGTSSPATTPTTAPSIITRQSSSSSQSTPGSAMLPAIPPRRRPSTRGPNYAPKQ